MTRDQIAQLIAEKVSASAAGIADSFHNGHPVQSAVVDDLLPRELADRVADAFPPTSQMRELKSVHEHKYTSKSLDAFDSIIREVTFAFQDPRVVRAVGEATGIEDLHGDPSLYAGGISAMTQGQFLLPHLDNSHDAERGAYRVLNLLYYVNRDWKKENGGNLELWDDGPNGKPREIVSAFNRLVIMATHKKSWHSVNEVRVPQIRKCVSNYYFSPRSWEGDEYFHVTSFRAREGKGVRDLVLRADNALRSAVRHVAKKGVYKPDVYPSSKDEGAD